MPSTFAEARETIETRFKAGWGTTTDLVFYDNMEGGPSASTQQWARFSVLSGETFLAGLGGGDKLYRTAGVAITQVFVKTNVGAKPALALADVAAAIFRGVTADAGILYRAPSILEVGPREGWYQVNVSVPFQWDANL